MPEKLLTPFSSTTFPKVSPTLLVLLMHYSCLSPLQMLPKLTRKTQHSRLSRIFKGQRVLHVYNVNPEKSRQGERGGTKPLEISHSS